MPSQLFRAHGKFCASHPWEVIVALLTLTACMAFSHSETTTATASRTRNCQGWRERCDGSEGEYIAADTILMTIIRCSAILYCYYRFLNLNKFGSKYILIIVGLFTVFSSFIFTSTIINFLNSEVYDLKDALFFFLLLIDLSKAGILAQLALSGTTQTEVIENISRGIEILGPALSLDSIVETLGISVGTLSGIYRLENLCSFAIVSVIVNYVVFMTFYPACLSLIMDLSKSGVDMTRAPVKLKDSMLISAIFEDDQKPNPVAQRLKIIMSTGMAVVHFCSRYVFTNSDGTETRETDALHFLPSNNTYSVPISEHIMKWLKIGSDQIIILILSVFTLLVKYFFFEDHIELTNQLQPNKIHKAMSLMDQNTQTDYIEQRQRTISTRSEASTVDANDDDTDLEEIIADRTIDECNEIICKDGGNLLTDTELVALVRNGSSHCPLYKIEEVCDNATRGVKIRRKIIAENAKLPLDKLNQLPYKHFDYTKVMNVCCENVLGYVQIPVGYAGPLTLDGAKFYVPMATTEGALVASTNRGCKVISIHGVTSFVEDIGMTRAPCVKFPSILQAAMAKRWIDTPENYQHIKVAFDSTSRFARLQEILINIDGPQLYMRFRALTGDAMGMNMVSKGCEKALRYIKLNFPNMTIISLSGNFCSDKKPAAINWIKGRGKRVVCETIVAASDLKKILKTDAKTLVQCNKLKNMAGSAMAGSIGGNNAHAANMVTAIFIACGQDPAQNVTSSNCSTSMDLCGDNSDDLYMTCTMPSLEVGTVGGMC